MSFDKNFSSSILKRISVKLLFSFLKHPCIARYELYATFTHSNGKYKGKYKERFDTLENLDGFKETNQLEQAENAEVTNVKVEEKRQYAPKLFSLSDLQSFANKRFKYSADKTLSIAQKLYEKKVLSYPRSDTNYIGSPEFDYLKSNLSRYLELAGVGISEPQLKGYMEHRNEIVR